MELLSLPVDALGFLWHWVVPFIFVLTIIVFFHELGHYAVARWNKVRVEAFSIGFGPELFGYTAKSGTRWKLSAIPLGGYVKFLGDGDAASRPDPERVASIPLDEREGVFEEKAVWRRASVVAAGPIANFILALVIYTGFFFAYGEAKLSPVVAEVTVGGAAESGGILPGDLIVAIDGTEVGSFDDVRRATMQSADTELTYTVERSGRTLDLPITPRMVEQTDRFGNEFKSALVGIVAKRSPDLLVRTDLNILESIAAGAREMVFKVKVTFVSIWELIVGKQDVKELRGPIGIGQIAGQVATLGLPQLIELAAMLSISIGILNLFPIPMLDGGHLVFHAIEAVRGRRVSERSQEWAFRAGFACVLLLIVFSTTNDIGRLINLFS